MKKMLFAAIATFCCILAAQSPANLFVNGDFSKADANGKPADWKSTSAEVVEEGVGGAKVLRLTAVNEVKTGFKGTVITQIPKLTPGKFLLKGEVKGNTTGLWLVLGFDNNLAGAKFTKWFSLPSNALKKDENGWAKFELEVEAPAGTARGMFVLEAFHGEKDSCTDLANFFLTEIK